MFDTSFCVQSSKCQHMWLELLPRAIEQSYAILDLKQYEHFELLYQLLPI